MKNEFFSRAKIILMGEYAVLHGADAICLPLKTGQKLTVAEDNDGQIGWKWVYGKEVLTAITLDAKTLQSIKSKREPVGWVSDLLRIIRLQNPGFLQNGGVSLLFENFFPPQWGLGSSAATISSLCRMANVNPFMVNQKLMGGSGADIASTTAIKWFLYRKKMPSPPTWEIPFEYPFKENTFFIYSGKKQPTAEHLKEIGQVPENSYSVSWLQANYFIYRFLAASTLPEALKNIYEHELLIGDHIKKECIGSRFPDFPGKLKSLGAWGGDFFLAISQQSFCFVKDYFQNKGYENVFGWDEFVERDVF